MFHRNYKQFGLLLTSLAVLVALLSVSGCDNEEASSADHPEDVVRFELVARSDVLTIGDGVNFEGFTFNGTMPGPQMVVREGDTVEITVVNEDSVTHGLSMHAANTFTSGYVGNIEAGETATLTFQADYPGVYMYHCAPGGHGIMTHTMGGQFGMLVVLPNEPYQMEQDLGREPDIEIFMIQHEVYRNGRDFFDGNAQYVMFNGETFRYVREPIQARPDDYIRFYFLNVGPNLTTTFHAVGGIWDYIYYGGNPNNRMYGTQSVVAGPTDSYVIDWQVPSEGYFTLVSHAFGTQAIKGAVGIIEAYEDNDRDVVVRSEGRSDGPLENPRRFVSPFGLGSEDIDYPVRLSPYDRHTIEMVGNSYYPKRVEIPVGTELTWINEDVFDMLEGELTGKHDVVIVSGTGDDFFSTELLDHAETVSYTFASPGTYEYICSIHPYMRGQVVVYDPATDGRAGFSGFQSDADPQLVSFSSPSGRQGSSPVISDLPPSSLDVRLSEATAHLYDTSPEAYENAMTQLAQVRQAFAIDPDVSDFFLRPDQLTFGAFCAF